MIEKRAVKKFICSSRRPRLYRTRKPRPPGPLGGATRSTAGVPAAVRPELRIDHVRIGHASDAGHSSVLTVMGPGIITASVDQDAGGMHHLPRGGLSSATRTIWSLPFLILALAVVPEMGTDGGGHPAGDLPISSASGFGVRLTRRPWRSWCWPTSPTPGASEFAGSPPALNLRH